MLVDRPKVTGPGPKSVWHRDAVQCEFDVSGGDFSAPLTPLDALVQSERVNVACFVHFPCLGQVTDDLGRVDWVVFHQSIESGTRWGEDGVQTAAVMDVPETRVSDSHQWKDASVMFASGDVLPRFLSFGLNRCRYGGRNDHDISVNFFDDLFLYDYFLGYFFDDLFDHRDFFDDLFDYFLLHYHGFGRGPASHGEQQDED